MVDRPRAIVLLLAALASAPSAASASESAPIAVRITEDVHEGCPREPTMLERIRARLPRVREAAEGEPAVDVGVTVARRGGTSHGTISLVSAGERAEREASSASCDRVLVALAVMAAIGLDAGELPAPAEESDEAAPSSGTDDAAPAPAPPPRPSRRATPRPSPRPAPAPRPRVSVALGTSAEVSANRSLVVTPGLFGQLGFPGRFAPVVRAGVRRSFRADRVSPFGTVGLRWSEVAVAGCGDVVQRPTMRLGPCLNAEGGVLEAVVIEPLPSRVRSAAWVSAGASARLSWRPLQAMSFELLGGVRAPLIRNQLLFEPAALVYEAPLVVPFVGASVLGHWP
ncbi:MAG: hypothetical protein KF782_00365 [Labilithrix sp.]|nr:hypothetical protein [Labilithrix sp.]